EGFACAVRADAPRRARRKQAASDTTATGLPAAPVASGATPLDASPATEARGAVDLERRRDQLTARFVELQWDLGGLVYEMAIRNRIRVDILVQRAAVLQDTDAELGEVERILRMEQTGTAGTCASCGAPHSSGAGYCWQCGQPILEQVPSESIFAP
ncbi:MAG: hypothetical protein M3071_05925, partial [Actinomycetota bacterium]|nr:hypothetical protein [Actinomycetota bacterium]